jgi:hypothetical protein
MRLSADEKILPSDRQAMLIRMLNFLFGSLTAQRVRNADSAFRTAQMDNQASK